MSEQSPLQPNANSHTQAGLQPSRLRNHFQSIIRNNEAEGRSVIVDLTGKDAVIFRGPTTTAPEDPGNALQEPFTVEQAAESRIPMVRHIRMRRAIGAVAVVGLLVGGGFMVRANESEQLVQPNAHPPATLHVDLAPQISTTNVIEQHAAEIQTPQLSH